jgi:hypothetical protein
MTLARMHPRKTHCIHTFVEHVRDLVVVIVEDKEKDRKTLFAADRDFGEVPSPFFSFLPATTKAPPPPPFFFQGSRFTILNIHPAHPVTDMGALHYMVVHHHGHHC